MEGRVEVQHRGSWGTVCGQYWDTDDARVVCRMLGYSMAAEALKGAAFGRGKGSIVLRGVGCKGEEESLFDCSHDKKRNCHHGHDAGVRCLSKYDTNKSNICNHYF